MPKQKLHIVAFDIPFPPDYGGAIDVFYKVKNLSEAGLEIYLHCSQYGDRKPSGQLEQLCKEVFYYERHTGLRGISFRYPYMVYSRKNNALLKNLQRIEAPILFDGVSTSYYLSHPSLNERLKILRPQNVEQDYYRLLAKREKNPAKKRYYKIESLLLKHYEDNLAHADAFFTVALHDHEFFRKKYPLAVHEYIPSFQPYNEVKTKSGLGEFCLYHGNFAIAENREAALYLMEEVVPHLKVPFVFAGRNPDELLIKNAATIANCSIIANPSMEQMDELISNAQIHVLPTFQNTGLKLKLLHALFNGRHAIVNEEMVYATGLANACNVCKNANEMIEGISKLISTPIDESVLAVRKQILSLHYNNKLNAKKIVTFLQQRSL